MSNWKLHIEFQLAHNKPSNPEKLEHWYNYIHNYLNKQRFHMYIDPPIHFIDLFYDMNINDISIEGLDKIDKNFVKQHHFETYNQLKLDNENYDIKVNSAQLVNMCPKSSFMRDYYNEQKARIDSLLYEPCRNGPDCKNRMTCRYIH